MFVPVCHYTLIFHESLAVTEMTHLFSGSIEQLGFDPLNLAGGREDKGQFSDRAIQVHFKLKKNLQQPQRKKTYVSAMQSHAMGRWQFIILLFCRIEMAFMFVCTFRIASSVSRTPRELTENMTSETNIVPDMKVQHPDVLSIPLKKNPKTDSRDNQQVQK